MQPIKIYLLILAVGILLGMGTMYFIMRDEGISQDRINELIAQRDSLSGENLILRGNFKVAEKTILAKESEMKVIAEALKGNSYTNYLFLRKIDSLNLRLSLIGSGQGNVTITGAGPPKDSMNYEDDWITAKATIDSNKLKYFEYTFDFEIGDIRATVDNIGGSDTEIFDVYIKSKKDSMQYLYVGDYARQTFVLVREYKMFNPWNPRLNLNVELGGNHPEFGLSINLSTINSKKDGGIIALLPDIGICTDFKNSTNVVVGARLNIARWLPLIENLHLFSHVGLPTNKFDLNSVLFRFGIGTSL